MAKRSATMRGGFDPSEMGRRSAEARRLRKEAAELRGSEDPDKGFSEADIASLPRDKLIQVLQDSTVHPRELVQAAKALAALPVDDESTGWRASTQVREDFVPPDWGQVLLVARAAGCFDKERR